MRCVRNFDEFSKKIILHDFYRRENIIVSFYTHSLGKKAKDVNIWIWCSPPVLSRQHHPSAPYGI